MDNLTTQKQEFAVTTDLEKFDVAINTVPGILEFNFEEAKKRIEQIAASYSIIVYDEDQEKQQKLMNADISTIRAHVKKLEDYKKKEKEKYMKPVNTFVDHIDTLISLFDTPYETLRRKKVEFQEEAKKKKNARIREFFNVICVDYPAIGDFKETLYDKIYNSKWENTNVSVSTYKDAIKEAIVSYCNGVSSINAVGGKYTKEGLEKLQLTLSLTSALEVMKKLEKRDEEIAEQNRIYLEQQRIQIQKEAEAAARRKVEEEMKQKELEFQAHAMKNCVEQPARTNTFAQKKEVITEEIEEIEMDFSELLPTEKGSSNLDEVTVSFTKEAFEQVKEYCDLLNIEYTLL